MPPFEFKDWNGDGALDFVFYEYNGCQMCTTLDIKTKVYQINFVTGRFIKMIEFVKKKKYFGDDVTDSGSIIGEDKTTTYFSKQHDLIITYWNRKKGRKWKLVKTEAYSWDKKEKVYKKT